jgi:hypothetical protein
MLMAKNRLVEVTGDVVERWRQIEELSGDKE